MSFEFQEILAYQFWGNTVLKYAIALIIFLAALFILKLFKTLVIYKIKKLADHTRTDFDDLIIKVIDSIGWSFYVFLSLYIALQFLLLPLILEKIIGWLLLLAVIYYLAKAVGAFIDFGAQKLVEKRREEEKAIDETVVQLLTKTLKGVVWAIAIIVFLQNLGYDITALVAGLGIGGLAIAFALQNILTDLFASFAIYFDKPFQVGDFIIVGKDLGTVKKIGIKSTRIQTLQGEELVVSNKELTTARVHNYKKMEKRRITFGFGVVYETSTEKLKAIPSIVKKIIDGIELTDFDRAHFKEFADFSLNFEVVYYLKSSDYNVYMDTQQEINFKIKEAFEKQGIEMAYPTQTVFVRK